MRFWRDGDAEPLPYPDQPAVRRDPSVGVLSLAIAVEHVGIQKHLSTRRRREFEPERRGKWADARATKRALLVDRRPPARAGSTAAVDQSTLAEECRLRGDAIGGPRESTEAVGVVPVPAFQVPILDVVAHVAHGEEWIIRVGGILDRRRYG